MSALSPYMCASWVCTHHIVPGTEEDRREGSETLRLEPSCYMGIKLSSSRRAASTAKPNLQPLLIQL